MRLPCISALDLADNTINFIINYNPNSIVLSVGVIPEPSTWALVALALAPFFLPRRSRV